MASGNYAKFRTDQQSNSQPWLYDHGWLLSESLRKLRNRRVPNGTHGGVRGRLLNKWVASYSIATVYPRRPCSFGQRLLGWQSGKPHWLNHPPTFGIPPRHVRSAAGRDWNSAYSGVMSQHKSDKPYIDSAATRSENHTKTTIISIIA